MKKHLGRKVYIIVMFAVLYLPIFYLILFSFNRGGTMQHFTGWTLRYYQELFNDSRLLSIVCQTFILALLSSIIATLIGLCGALFLHQLKRSKRTIWLQLNNILMVSPDVVIGASFLIVFTLLGFKLGFTSVLLSHIAFSIPIVVIMLLPKMDQLNPTMFDAAEDLGATRWQVLTRVILPQLVTPLIIAYFMAFTYSLDDFAVTFFVTGNGFSTLSVEIYSRARQGISLEINALSTILFLMSLLLVVGYYLLSQNDKEA